jgi:hypothetical protein
MGLIYLIGLVHIKKAVTGRTRKTMGKKKKKKNNKQESTNEYTEN